MHQKSSRLLRNQIKREQRALKNDKAELARLEAALASSFTLRQKQERGLHPLARLIDEEEDEDEGEDDSDDDGHGHGEGRRRNRLSVRENIEIAGIPAHSAPFTTTLSIDSGPDSHPDLGPLLKQLRNHLQSMENNTASVQPVLTAMSEAQVALDLFAAARLDEQTKRRLHGLDT